jgi:acetyl-CoA carboxylase carboxyl transferase subunit alpha
MVRVTEEVRRLRRRFQERQEESAVWEAVDLARHPERPYTLDYAGRLFSDLFELHGDRAFADDPSIVAGVARYHDEPVVFVGHQKGRDLTDRNFRNFGMARPEGYRKGIRAMELADRLGIPVITFVDTPGAFPGAGSEERGQAGMIARSILAMARLHVPVVSCVIGEGGSGGASAPARRRRPGADAGERDLQRHLAGGVRLDPVEGLVAEEEGSAGLPADRAGLPRPGRHRCDRPRAVRRRPP